MCGISGVYNYNNKNIDSKLIIKRILKTQHNRGPDELYSRKKTGLAIPLKKYLKKLSYNNIKYSHPIKDWSIFSYKKFINCEKQN